MKAEVREWWLELADQYEEWAENPPIIEYWCCSTGHTDWEEDYTCCALDCDDETWGFSTNCRDDPSELLGPIWEEQYGAGAFPIGETHWASRQQKRFDFCWYMAERIREYLGEEA